MPSSDTGQTRRRRPFVTLLRWTVGAGLLATLAGAAGIGWLYFTIAPTLPDVQQLREVQLQLPLRVYTAEGDLIAEYGEKRREPVLISQVPQHLRNAILAAEDGRFYEHPGVDYQGLLRAAWHLVRTGEKGPGGSTITMQVARNFFLTNERTYARKLTEIFLSFKIESELTKDEILELYLNKIYLGNRAYGFAAASRVYYGKDIQDIDLTEAAMLAGLPKAPSRFNPIVNPERATIRRNYVLRRLHELGLIDGDEFRESLAVVDDAKVHKALPETEAAYVGEMARARIQALYGDEWATGGFDVYTTLRTRAQNAANHALRSALYDYEARHGYRGPVTKLDAETLSSARTLLEALDNMSTPGDLEPAAVIAVDAESAMLVTADGSRHELGLDDVAWARRRVDVDRMGDEVKTVDQVFAFGDVVHVRRETGVDGDTVRFVQKPEVEGAFVAIEPGTGAVIALVGGFDFNRSKFNRAVQARRQPGSTFKPFIYSAALHAGNTPATLYNDAPVVFHDAALEGEWRPSNYSGRFFGPTRLREALVKSRNLVSIRVLREIGIPYAVDYATRFGFERKRLPKDLSLALGSATVTPLELAGAFSVFANGGYRVPAHLIDRIEDPRGKVLYEAPKVVRCDDCGHYELIDPRVANGELVAGGEARDPGAGGLRDVSASVAEAARALDNDPAHRVDDTIERSFAMPIDIVDAPRVIDARNAYLMDSMMREVVRRGTARSAGEALGRTDFAGKTGTTNDQLDAWFVGYHSDLAATAWIGSDGLSPLGRGEAGGIAALPMWTEFMSTLSTDLPERPRPEPDGIATVRIDPRSGEPSSGDQTMLEIFLAETAPRDDVVRTDDADVDDRARLEGLDSHAKELRAREVEQLF